VDSGAARVTPGVGAHSSSSLASPAQARTPHRPELGVQVHERGGEDGEEGAEPDHDEVPDRRRERRRPAEVRFIP
jgi:hypothetical protein